MSDRSIAIDVDPACLARVEAYATQKRKTLPQLVNDYLRSVGNDLTGAELPRSACNRHIHMLRHRGRDTTAGFLAQGHWDEFERPMPTYFYAWARERPGLVIDGGANTGFYALLAANASAENQVLAFEPDPLLRGYLQSNLEMNALESRIRINPAALTDQVGTGALYIPSQDHGVIETSASLEGKFKGKHAQVVPVQTTTVDAVTRSAGQRVTLIKLDVASHEATALAGAERTVAEHRPLLFVEVLNKADFGALSLFISRHNYLDVPLRSQGVLTGQGVVTFDNGAYNHALVPAEALPRFLAASRADL